MGGSISKCVMPSPILQSDGRASGFVRCADGAVNRVGPVPCTTAVANRACDGSEGYVGCTSDADCTDAPHGVCRHREPDTSPAGGSGPDSFCDCIYPCETDADCSDGSACLCAGVLEPANEAPGLDDLRGYSHCAPAGCSADADCASGECGAYFWYNGCSYIDGLACREPSDACRTGACDGYQAFCGVRDGLSGPKEWQCETANCEP